MTHILEKCCDAYFPSGMKPEEKRSWVFRRFDCICTSVGLDYWELYRYAGKKKDENNS
jgi:hypothetical protein